MNKLDQNIRKISLTTGIVLGIIQVILNIFLFYLITSLSTSPPMTLLIGPQLCSLVIPLVLAIMLSINIRSKVGGLWTFKQAVTGIFIMLFAAYLIKIAGNDIIFDRLIEPHSVEKILAADTKAEIQIQQEKHASQKEIDAAATSVQKHFAVQNDVSVWRTIQSDVIFILFLFVFALVLAALLRNAKYVSSSDAA